VSSYVAHIPAVDVDTNRDPVIKCVTDGVNVSHGWRNKVNLACGQNKGLVVSNETATLHFVALTLLCPSVHTN
jgi:hypothetical protein